MFKTLEKLTFAAVIFASLVLAGSLCFAGELSVPITVHEALREGVPGIDRKGEPVTAGIPFPEGELHEKNGVPQLALEGASDYQFRTLARWPDGSVKWVLADFQADVSSGGKNGKIRIIPGGGNTPGRLAEERGDAISVNTGEMAVTIRKKGFNLFDSVVAGGHEIISPGASRGIVVKGDEGSEYLASNDRNAKVTIEENGPVRAVVKAEGAHMGSSGRMLDYTVRMHFYKGKTRVRVFYTLRNASKNQFEQAHILSLDLVTKTNSGPYAVASKHNGSVKERLGDGNELVYYQAVSDFPQSYGGDSFYYHAPIPPDFKREGQRGFAQEGYWIKDGDKVLAEGKKSEYPDLGYADLRGDDGSGATIGVRYAAGWWPKSLKVRSDGTATVGLWPGESGLGYWIRYGSHNTFEVMYDFHPSKNDPEASMKKFQYPLVAKAAAGWYDRSVEGIEPLYSFVSFDDERGYIGKEGWSYPKKATGRSQELRIFRYFYWGWGGFENQHDFARINLVNFLRDTDSVYRAGEYFLYAEARLNYNADWAIYHSDDYVCTDCTKRGYGPAKGADKAVLAGVTFDYEHPHWYGMPLYYYLTGDERIREAIIDFGDILKEWGEKNWIFVDPRHFGWEMYNLAAMYDFTGDASYMRMADNLFDRFARIKMNPQNPWQSIFMDWDRGYVAGGSGSGWKGQAGLKPGLMTGYAIYDGLANYYLHMDGSNPLKKRVADVMEGISEFMYREPYFEGKARGKDIIWLPYIYNLDDRQKSMHEYMTLRQAFYVNLIPYLLNGEDRWLERMDKIIRTAAMDSPDHLDQPGLQSMLYLRTHPRANTRPPAPVKDLSARVEGAKVMLTWTAPDKAARYQIKYSEKKLVESLEFDPDKRVYRYDPSEYANWWAGENTAAEPAPGGPGTTEKAALNGLKPGRYYFAVRSWDSSNNRSRISNLAEVEIK